MPIYQEKLDTKLGAMLDKNTTQMAADHVYLPFLGSDYTAAQADTWINKRVSTLQDIDTNNYTDVQIENMKSIIYNQLSIENKVVADQIIGGNSFSLNGILDEGDYDRLIALILIMHVTTP